MISSVRGTVLSAVDGTAVIEVGGIGLAVRVTPAHALTLRTGAEATVHTALIVREDELSLYGFESTEELAVFDLLRGVSGVGPKSAMGVLGTLSPGQIAAAVAAEDDSAFRKVSGIGPKTAKLIVVSLAGKLAAVSASVTETTPDAGISASVTAALVGLGWPERTAAAAVEESLALAGAAEKSDVQALLRLTLSRLGPQSLTGSGRT